MPPLYAERPTLSAGAAPPKPSALAAFYHRKKDSIQRNSKEWVKLNATLLTGTGAGMAGSFAGAYAARKWGVDPDFASSYVGRAIGFAVGTVAGAICWFSIHRELYRGHIEKMWRHQLKLARNAACSEAISLAISGVITISAVRNWGLPIWAGVTIQLVLDNLVFGLPYNALNAGLVEETHAFEQEQRSRMAAQKNEKKDAPTA